MVELKNWIKLLAQSNFEVYITHHVNEIPDSTITEDWQYAPTQFNILENATCYFRLFNRPDFIYNDSVTKTNYVSCNLVDNSNPNVNVNKIENEIFPSTSAKPVINWSYYSPPPKLIRHLAMILKLKVSSIHWTGGKGGQSRLYETKHNWI